MTAFFVNRAYKLYGFSPLVQLIRKSKVTTINGEHKVHLFTCTYSTLSKDKNLRKSIRNHVDVSLTLAKQVFSSEVKGESNLVLSPLSINIILGLIAAGSKDRTRDELLAFLKSESPGDLNAFYSRIIGVIFADGSPVGGPIVSSANGLWIDQTLPPLKPSFKLLVESVYNANSESVDFQNKADEVVKKVNLWAEKETRGLIKNVLSDNSVDHTTMLILANALYFNGAWTDRQFDPSMTKDHRFYLLNGSSVKVPLMSSRLNRQYVKAFNGFKVLQLPYKQGKDKLRNFSMYIFLPDAIDGLPSLVDKVCSKSGFLERHLPKYLVKMDKFRIPKFKISFGFEASAVLKELGVVSAFEGGLTEMVDSPEDLHLNVSSIFHSAVIKVDELGTEAAAVTLIGMGCSRMADKVDFVADHPFLFVIREDLSGVIVFIGTLLNPSLLE